MVISKAYDTLAVELSLPKMTSGGVRVVSQKIDDADVLWAQIQKINPVEGWLQFQSYQGTFSDGLPQLKTAWGRLLSAEAVTAEGNSLSVMSNGQGGWRLLKYVEDSEMPGLWDDVHQLAHNRKSRDLRYRRYWVDDSEQGFVQKHACFIGFE